MLTTGHAALMWLPVNVRRETTSRSLGVEPSNVRPIPPSLGRYVRGKSCVRHSSGIYVGALNS